MELKDFAVPTRVLWHLEVTSLPWCISGNFLLAVSPFEVAMGRVVMERLSMDTGHTSKNMAFILEIFERENDRRMSKQLVIGCDVGLSITCKNEVRRSCKAHFGRNVWWHNARTHHIFAPSAHNQVARVFSKPSARDAQGSLQGRELVPLSGELFRIANDPCNVFLQIRNISTERGRFSKTPPVLALLIPIHEQRIAMGTTNKANGAKIFIFFYALLGWNLCVLFSRLNGSMVNRINLTEMYKTGID
uniref:Uncharacterized protein n=1 Tax=Vespula pensylvanica TaxID=30213 RepID=A0A834U943_VESPE|nr:hypothetical protein H0235_008469 [Vespula pensylvanica]